MTAGNGTDILVVGGTAGTTLVGGTGKDTFVFQNNLTGLDTVKNFSVANDTLQFNKTLYANYAAAMAHASQVGANTVFTIDSHDSVTLQSITKTSLTTNNFRFA